jgi:hypothetical protein
MVSKELNDWLQVVGLFGVLGGLIFVGLQLRLDRQVALSQDIAEASTTRMYWAEIIADHPEVWVKGSSGDPLSPAEAAQFNALATSWELSWYSAWTRSTQLGAQTPERFVKEVALDLHSHPGLMMFWRTHQERMSRVDPASDADEWMLAVDGEIRRLEAGISAR